MNTNGSISFIGVIGVILLVLAGLAGIVILLRKFDWWVGECCEKWIAKVPEERRSRAAGYFSIAAFISAIIGVIITLIALWLPYRNYSESMDAIFRLIALFCVIFSFWTYSFCRSVQRGFRITPRNLRWTSWLNASVIIMSTFSLLFFVLIALTGPHGGSNIVAARTSIQSICVALDVYELEVGSYPTETQGFAVLTNSHRRNQKKPYLERIPLSPWGEPFIYRLDNGKPVISARKPDGDIISN
jgi:general secretion pathway protein G